MKHKLIITSILFLFISSLAFAQKGIIKTDLQTTAQCQLCKDRIENALVYTNGIKDAILNINSKIVTVTYKESKISKQEIITILTELGYDVEGQKGNQEAYEKLPTCCKKPEDR